MRGIDYYFCCIGFVKICFIKEEMIYFFFIYCFNCEILGLFEYFYVIGIDGECVLINVFGVGF